MEHLIFRCEYLPDDGNASHAVMVGPSFVVDRVVPALLRTLMVVAE